MSSNRRQRFEALSSIRLRIHKLSSRYTQRPTWVLCSPSRKDISESQFVFVPNHFTLSFNDTSVLHHLLLPQLMGSRLWKEMAGAFAVPVTA